MSDFSILLLNWKDIKNPRAGGGTLYTHKVLAYLSRKGYRVKLLTANYPGGKKQEVIDGITVLRVGKRYTVYGIVPLKYLKDLRGCFDIIIDEINVIPWFTPLYIRDIPILAFIHQTGRGVLSLEVGSTMGILLRSIERTGLLLYRDVLSVTVSESVKDELVRAGLSPTKVTVVPPGIDYEKYQVKLSEKADYPLILYVGRLTRYKGIEYLIKATKYLLERLPTLKVSIVGRGNYLNDLVKLRDGMGLKKAIKFHGYVSEMEKVRLMQSAHLLVNPSVNEGFGIVVIEAAACGTPAVGTDTTGLRDTILPNKTGFLVPYGRPLALAEKISEALDPEIWTSLSRNAKARASKFDWSNTLPQFEKVINLAVQGWMIPQ